jgi:AcrR family transcriptional regulator
MQAEKENRKVKYTKMVIRESLFELLKTKQLNQITVKELCKLADINRGTFYSHYTDLFDLVQKLEEALIKDMKAVIKFENIGQDNQLEMFVEIFSHIRNNVEDYQILLLNPNSSRILDELIAEAYEHHLLALEDIKVPISKNMVDYSFALVSSGSARVIMKWIENDFAEPPEEMARLINHFTNTGFSSLPAARTHQSGSAGR